MIEERKVDIEIIKQFLSGIDMFSGLPENVIADMAKPMCLYRFDKGEYLIVKNKAARFMYLIQQGTVSVKLDDKNIPLSVGAVLGEMSLLSGQRSTADVVAETETSAFIINRFFFKKLISEHAELESVMSILMKSRSAEN